MKERDSDNGHPRARHKFSSSLRSRDITTKSFDVDYDDGLPARSAIVSTPSSIATRGSEIPWGDPDSLARVQAALASKD
jgi:hypothetical protein